MTRFIQLGLGCSIVLFLIYCMHFNLNVSDEGYYLYHFQHGADVIGFNFYHLLISPVGELFDHLLIGYRYLNVALVIGSSLFLYGSISTSIPTYWLLPLCSALLYFNQITTLSYNSMVLSGGAIFLALVYQFISSKPRVVHSLMIGLIAFFVFSARFGVGLLLFSLGIALYFLLLEDKKEALKLAFLQLIAFVLPLGLLYLIFPDYFPAMIEYIKMLTGVSHEGVLLNYIEHFTRYALRAVLPPLVMLVLTCKWPKFQKVFSGLYLIWFVYAHMLKQFYFPSLFYYFSGFIIAVIILKLHQRWKSGELNRMDLAFTILPIIIYLNSVSGSNNNAMKAAPFYFIFLVPGLIYLVPGKKQSGLLLSIGFSLITFICLYQNQYLKSYGSPPRFNQTYTASSLKILAGIKIDQQLEQEFLQILEMLTREEFNHKRDKVFVYANNSGHASYLGLKVFGALWNTDVYKRSDFANCYSVLKEDVSLGGQVFFVLNKELTIELQDCLKPKVPLLESRTLLLSTSEM